MTSLFVLELNAWLTIDTTTRIVLDSNGDDTMQVHIDDVAAMYVVSSG